MNNLMEYKGYHAKIEFSPEDDTFVGRVLGINDVLAFDGESKQELKEMFQECIDEYLAECAELGKEPDKEYKGTFNVRITPELHKQAVLESESRNISLNQFVQQAIENELEGGHVRETVTIVMPERSYSMHGENANFITGNYGKEEVVEAWQENMKFQGFVS